MHWHTIVEENETNKRIIEMLDDEVEAREYEDKIESICKELNIHAGISGYNAVTKKAWIMIWAYLS